jgi:transposase
MYLNKWYYWATYSNIEEITKLNNGVAEGLNNRIRTAFKKLYVFKAEKYRNTMIYLVAGKLDLLTRS